MVGDDGGIKSILDVMIGGGFNRLNRPHRAHRLWSKKSHISCYDGGDCYDWESPPSPPS